MTNSYPNTHKGEETDEYFGVRVKDPFRWLENDKSEEVKKWLKEEQEYTENYLQNIPFREKIFADLEERWNVEKTSLPFERGDWIYFFKNTGLQAQSILYRRKAGQSESEAEIFLDPMSLSDDHKTAISSLSFSKSGTYLALGINSCGSNWSQIWIMNAQTKEWMEKLRGTQFVGDGSLDYRKVQWKKDEGFFYSYIEEPKQGEENKAREAITQIRFHKLATEQSEDSLFYEQKDSPSLIYGLRLSKDEKHLILTPSYASHSNKVYAFSLEEEKPQAKKIIDEFETEFRFVECENNILTLFTYKGAKNGQLISYDLSSELSSEKTYIEEKEEALDEVYVAGDDLVLHYLHNACSKVILHKKNSGEEREIKLPTFGTVFAFEYNAKENKLYYIFTSFTYPPEQYVLDLASFEQSLFRKSSQHFDSENYEAKQVWSQSKDGTKVPLFVVHKKGLLLNGENPTLLYGYGGFNISLPPHFSLSHAYFLEQGGIFFLMTLRGGGEFGDDWHKAGMKEKKQNVFDDCIGAAEYLIAEKYTKAGKIVLYGGSNGGLLAGACLLQRPELFAASIPVVGVLDMLRYHKFTAGIEWVEEYGSSDTKEDFEYLYKYSPYHEALRCTKKLPPVFVMTSDSDDNVVPLHSYKFAAALQSTCEGGPFLLYVEEGAGHSSGLTTKQQIQSATDRLSFLFFVLGMEHKKMK